MSFNNFNSKIKFFWEESMRKRNLLKNYNQGFNYMILDHYINNEWSDIPDSAVFDGNNDGGIDIAFIDENSNEIVLIQNKNYEVIQKEQVKNPINKVIDLIDDIINEKYYDYKKEVKNFAISFNELVRNNNKIKIKIIFIASSNLPNNWNSESFKTSKIKYLQEKFKNKNLEANVMIFGKKEISNLIMKNYSPNGIEGQTKLRLKITGKSARDSLLKFQDEIKGITTYLGVLEGTDIREKYIKWSESGDITSLFAWNVREYIENKNVDGSIKYTLENDPYDFFVLNNGLTIIGENIEPDGNSINITNMCILNGAQTTTLIGKAGNNIDMKSVGIFAKIIDISNSKDKEKLISSISSGSNNQKPIKFQDLLTQNKLIKAFADNFNNNSEMMGSNLYFQLKRSDETRKISKNNSKTIITIDNFIKEGLWSIYIKPGTSKSGFNSWFNNDENSEKTLLLFKLLESNKDVEKFKFIQNRKYLLSLIEQYANNNVKILDKKEKLNEDELNFYNFLRTGKLYIATTIVAIKNYIDDNNFLEIMGKESNILNYYDSNKKRIKFLFNDMSSERTENIKKFLMKFVPRMVEELMASLSPDDKNKMISNITKTDETFYRFAKKFINKFYINAEIQGYIDCKELIDKIFSN